MIVILDNGHGINTPGKRSPEGMGTKKGMTALFEYEFNRDIVCRTMDLLDKAGINYIELVPEIEDISLRERCDRSNKIYQTHPGSFLVSVHANAGGGTGWEVFTSVGETESDVIADVFFKEAEKAFPEWRMRSDIADGDFDKEAHFYILKNTDCPAILTENFFMDNPKDLSFIMSSNGRQRIAQMHSDAIEKYMNMI